MDTKDIIANLHFVRGLVHSHIADENMSEGPTRDIWMATNS